MGTLEKSEVVISRSYASTPPCRLRSNASRENPTVNCGRRRCVVAPGFRFGHGIEPPETRRVASDGFVVTRHQLEHPSFVRYLQLIS